MRRYVRFPLNGSKVRSKYVMVPPGWRAFNLTLHDGRRTKSVPYATAEEAIHAAELCGDAGAPVPDLMMLDYNLPRGNGSDILAVAGRNPKLAAVPKVIVTSFLQADELAQALELGASCLITKPVDFDQFISVIKFSDFRCILWKWQRDNPYVEVILRRMLSALV